MAYIELTGQKNTRDLGGIVTLDGKHIKRRRLIRSGRITELTAADISILLARYQLRTVVDFRAPKEISEYPDPRWGIVEHYDLPVLSDAALGFTKNDNTGNTVLDALTGMAAAPGFSALEYMKENYRKLINEGQARGAYRHFFELLLAQKDGSLLYHCNGGKDRTGLATVFLLTALGVSWQVIYEDYLADQCLPASGAGTVPGQAAGEIPERESPGDGKGELFLVDDTYLQVAREEMCKAAGTPLYYVQNVLGVDETIRWNCCKSCTWNEAAGAVTTSARPERYKKKDLPGRQAFFHQCHKFDINTCYTGCNK
jgi:protein-tyrosine phosphatase